VTGPGQTPQQRIESACATRGRAVVVQACIDLLSGHDVDPALVVVLGGQHTEEWLDRPVNRYWLRVWATRGLLWAWEPQAWGTLQSCFTDEAWRVREMAAKVVARHRLGDATGAMSELTSDPVPRVRQAAVRALVVLTAAEA